MNDVEIEVEKNQIIIRPVKNVRDGWDDAFKVMVAPMTSVEKDYPTRVSCTFRKKQDQIVLDRIRTLDKSRLIKKLGKIDSKAQLEVISTLQRMFAF